MWAPKLRTPGMARSSLLACSVIRTISGMRGAGLGHPVHQEVPLLERGQQRLPEQRRDHDAGQRDDADGERTPGAAR